LALLPTPITKLGGEAITFVAAGGKHAVAIARGTPTTYAFAFKPLVGSQQYSDMRCAVVSSVRCFCHVLPLFFVLSSYIFFCYICLSFFALHVVLVVSLRLLTRLFARAAYVLSFLVEGKEVAAHRAIVFARCPYLRSVAQLHARYNRASMTAVPVGRGVRHAVFLAVLRFLYVSRSVLCVLNWALLCLCDLCIFICRFIVFLCACVCSAAHCGFVRSLQVHGPAAGAVACAGRHCGSRARVPTAAACSVVRAGVWAVHVARRPAARWAAAVVVVPGRLGRRA
jgi:hypothetical protein